MTENAAAGGLAPMIGAGSVLGLVLAGGQSRRMGADKTRVLLAGRPMIERVVSRLSPQVSQLVISSNENAGEFAALGAPVVGDLAAGFPGPLAGLEAGLRYAREAAPGVTHVLSVSTDTPFLPRTLCEDLAAGLGGGAGAAVAQSRGQTHWVVGLWPIAALAEIEAALGRGDLKVQRVLEGLGPRVVAFSDIKMGGEGVDPFFNVNTPEELAEAEAMLARRGVPVFGVAGWSGAGKTTLVCRLIAALSDRGLRVGSIKHSHHGAPSSGEDTDTARHAAHGALRVAFVAPQAWGIVPDVTYEPEPSLSRIVAALGDVDVVIVEGMKGAPIPKIEVRSGAPSDERPALSENDRLVFAIAQDDAGEAAGTPVFRRDDGAGLARCVLSELGL